MNAPGSPSSPLQMTYFGEPAARRVRSHFVAVGNPAPPRPRRPDDRTRAITSSGVSRVRHGSSARMPSRCAVVVERQRVHFAAVLEDDAHLLADVGRRVHQAVVMGTHAASSTSLARDVVQRLAHGADDTARAHVAPHELARVRWRHVAVELPPSRGRALRPAARDGTDRCSRRP